MLVDDVDSFDIVAYSGLEFGIGNYSAAEHYGAGVIVLVAVVVDL